VARSIAAARTPEPEAAREGEKPVAPVGTSPSATAEHERWPEPQPLPEGLPAVAPFDFALLPATLRPWAEDIHERVQCPPDFLGAAIMAALGSVLGRKIGIRPQERTDWTELPNQWSLLIGRPGVLKTPAIEAALAPLKALAARAAECYEVERANHRVAARRAKLAAEEGEKAARALLAKQPGADVTHLLRVEEPQEPALRRYITSDTTAAALGELLRQNPNGLLVYRDEMISLMRALDREENVEARGFYLTGWSGNTGYTIDRIGRGLHLHIPAVCLSLLGSTQPGSIAQYLRVAVRGGAGDDGLIQRFGLLVWPDTGGAWQDVDRLPDSRARREAFAVFERLDSLNPQEIGAVKDEFHPVPYLRFDPEGLTIFREWRADLETKLGSGELHPALESHLAKYRKLVPGLALILHLGAGGSGPVGKRPVLQALAWAEYLETHARRAYASVVSHEVAAAKAILQKLRRGELPRVFAARDVYRPCWAHLSDREQVRDALALLVDLDWLAVHTRETAGRTATVFEANPRGLAS
jgi:putative DNA primase/helicase